jgi:sec-independent protein translocase protein TatC
MNKLRRIGHDDHLSVIEHLDELRWRIVVSVAALGVAFGLCAWQNHRLLDLLNEPLPDGRLPITFGVTEPFLTTVTVAGYAALVLALPVILYQVYAFVMPALRPGERGVALPVLLLMPLLFIAGVLFSYFVVLGPAVKFLLNFNDSQFDIQVRARDYYGFVSLLMLSMGVLFQVPMALLVASRLGIVDAPMLRRRRREAIVVSAIVAALLPTVDPVSLLLEMVPLLVLFELSIVLVSVFGRPRGQALEPAAPVQHPG